MSTKSRSGKSKSKKSHKETKSTSPDYSNLDKDTQVVPIESFDFSRLVYAEPQKNDVPGGSGHYRRVRLSYLYDDGKIGPPMVQLSKRYCFGVQPNNVDKDGKPFKDPNTGQPKPLTGYKVPIVMTSKEPTKEELADLDFFDSLRADVQRYAEENAKRLGKGREAKEGNIKSIVSEVLYRKKDDDGEFDESSSPKLYLNLLYFHKKREMQTVFYGPGDQEIDPLSQTGHFYIYPTIRIDSLYISKGISLQLKCYDATVEPVARPPRKRLAPTSKLDPEDDAPETLQNGLDNPNDLMESDESDSDGGGDE